MAARERAGRGALWFLLALAAPCLLAPLIAWDAPVLCRLDGRAYAPGLAALLGLPAPGPFGRAGADPSALLAADRNSLALWPALRSGPRRTGAEVLAPSSRAHPLGTDSAGRDLLAQLLHGGRATLLVALLSGLAALGLGLPLGMLAAMRRGWTDLLACRFAEIVAAFPSFFLVLAVMAWHGPDPLLLGVLLGLTRWVGLFRLTRAEFLRLQERDFVLAARALGMRPLRIAVREILPHAWGPLLVALAFLLSGSILLEAGLTWIGLGVGPETPSWGHMLGDAHAHLARAPGLLWPPALALFLMALAWNTAGEAIRRRLDVQG